MKDLDSTYSGGKLEIDHKGLASMDEFDSNHKWNNTLGLCAHY